MLTLKQKCHHLKKFSLLAALEVVKITTSGAANDKKNCVKMMTFPFQVSFHIFTCQPSQLKGSDIIFVSSQVPTPLCFVSSYACVVRIWSSCHWMMGCFNEKFMEDSPPHDPDIRRVKATKFGTWHDSNAVVPCATFCSHLWSRNRITTKCYSSLFKSWVKTHQWNETQAIFVRWEQIYIYIYIYSTQ